MLLVKNAEIYTSDDKQARAEAMVIDHGEFLYVGDIPSAEAFIDSKMNESREGNFLEIKDLEGKMVIPGMIDAHTHIGLSVIMGGDEDDIPMWDCKSKEEILQKLKDHVKRHPFRLYYVAFFGLIEALDGELLRAEEIDSIVKRRPVILLEQECHSGWLNSAALKLFKINDDIEDPAPGYCYYERDEEGRLTGCLKEMTLLKFLELNGHISDKKMKAGILKIMNYLLKYGVTTVYDAGNYIDEENIYKLLSRMDREEGLPVNVQGTYIITRPDMAEDAIDTLKKYKEKYETEHLKFNTVKIMFDGTHRIKTARIVEPYCGTDITGGTMLDEERLHKLLSDLNREGINFHAHTVGEGASKMILDCVEKVKEEQGSINIHITLAHLESQLDEDIPRFAELGVIGNYSPHWHGGLDYGTIEDTEKLLGKKRANNLFRAKSMMDSGALVTFSSDEVTLQLLDRWNPFLGIQIGVTRQEVNDGGREAEVFPPESERLTVEDMLKGYTINGAKALGMDDEIGSIEAGKSADFVVLPENILEMDPYEIADIIPEEVYIKGVLI